MREIHLHVARYLLSLTLRPPAPSNPETPLSVDRRILYLSGELPEMTRAEFYAAVFHLSDIDGLYPDLYGAVRQVAAHGNRTRLVLSRDVEDWEPIFYDDTDAEISRDVVVELLTDRYGFDLSRPLPSSLVPRGRVSHDPDVPRVCSRCRRLLATSEFNRRGAPGTPRHGQFMSWCRACSAEYAREFRAANPGYDSRTGRGRVDGSRPRSESSVSFG